MITYLHCFFIETFFSFRLNFYPLQAYSAGKVLDSSIFIKLFEVLWRRVGGEANTGLNFDIDYYDNIIPNFFETLSDTFHQRRNFGDIKRHLVFLKKVYLCNDHPEWSTFNKRALEMVTKIILIYYSKQPDELWDYFSVRSLFQCQK